MRPFVSVCIPTYNRANFLKTAIASVLSQTLKDFEIIVVDNCSDDDTENVIKSIDDRRLLYFKNHHNIGMVANFNRCIDLSRAEYISILHSDDYFEPNILEEESNLFDENPRVGMVYSAYQIAHELSGQKKILSPHSRNQLFEARNHFEWLALRGNPVAFSSVMVRRECYRRVGAFNTSLPFSSDYEMWLRLSLCYAAAYLATPLVTYRFHREMDSFSFFRSSHAIDQEWAAIESALKSAPWPDHERRQWLGKARRCLAARTMRRAFFHADKGMDMVRQHLVKAALINPLLRLHPLFWLIRAFSLIGDRAFSLVNTLRINWLRNARRPDPP